MCAHIHRAKGLLAHARPTQSMHTSSYSLGSGLGLGAAGGGRLASASWYCVYAVACSCAWATIVVASSGICCCTICMISALICGRTEQVCVYVCVCVQLLLHNLHDEHVGLREDRGGMCV